MVFEYWKTVKLYVECILEMKKLSNHVWRQKWSCSERHSPTEVKSRLSNMAKVTEVIEKNEQRLLRFLLFLPTSCQLLFWTGCEIVRLRMLEKITAPPSPRQKDFKCSSAVWQACWLRYPWMGGNLFSGNVYGLNMQWCRGLARKLLAQSSLYCLMWHIYSLWQF